MYDSRQITVRSGATGAHAAHGQMLPHHDTGTPSQVSWEWERGGGGQGDLGLHDFLNISKHYSISLLASIFLVIMS